MNDTSFTTAASITGVFNMQGNTLLASCGHGFTTLRRVTGIMTIGSNGCTALRFTQLVSVGQLYLWSNPALVTLDGDSFPRLVTASTLEITGHGASFTTIQDAFPVWTSPSSNYILLISDNTGLVMVNHSFMAMERSGSFTIV